MSKGKKNTAAQRTSTKWCKDCGYKIHGPNHAEGTHHKTHKK